MRETFCVFFSAVGNRLQVPVYPSHPWLALPLFPHVALPLLISLSI
jgi:hypothetical protein